MITCKVWYYYFNTRANSVKSMALDSKAYSNPTLLEKFSEYITHYKKLWNIGEGHLIMELLIPAHIKYLNGSMIYVQKVSVCGGVGWGGVMHVSA